MKTQGKVLIVILILALIITTVFIVDKITDRIPPNPPETVGNTPGNLYNGGMFCEDSDGVVFFANPFDEYTLYRMNADETDVERIFASGVSHINAGADHLYFYVHNSSSETGLGFVRRVVGLYRCTKKGKDTTTLCRDPASALTLVGDTIYLQHYDTETNTTLWKFSTDGKTSSVVSKNPINPSSCTDGYLYYTDTADTRFLHRMDTTSDSESVFVKYDMWNPIRKDDYIYFMDMHNNYRLCRYHLTDETLEVLSEDRLDMFNLSDEYVYYQKSSSDAPALKRVTLDGSSEEIVAEGIYSSIGITSRYAYFTEFGGECITYHTPVNGAIAVSIFDAAIPLLED